MSLKLLAFSHTKIGQRPPRLYGSFSMTDIIITKKQKGLI